MCVYRLTVCCRDNVRNLRIWPFGGTKQDVFAFWRHHVTTDKISRLFVQFSEIHIRHQGLYADQNIVQ